MKKLLFILSLSFSCFLFSQERNGITYQALIVDPSGEFLPGADNNYSPLINTSVCLKFHIIDSTNSYEYSEQHTVTTDNFGMVNLVIGTGSVIGGVGWENVSWSASAKSLKVDVDKTGSCSSFEELSNQPLTSVPFALYSPGSNTPGPQGDPGEEGISAYEVWLDLGNTGTEQDFIDSLKGPEGDPGDPGADGDSAYDVWIEAGNTGTEQEFLDSLKGAVGNDGILTPGDAIGNTTYWNGTEWVTTNNSLYNDGNNIMIGTTTAEPSSAFTVASNSQGVLLPKMTLSQRDGISNPTSGLLIFQTDNMPGFYYFDGTSWKGLIQTAPVNSGGSSDSNTLIYTTNGF